MTETKARGGIQSLERAAAILGAVSGAGRDGITLNGIAEATGINTSTAFSLCRTLEDLGFLARIGDSKRFRIGSRLFVLAAGALDEGALLTQGTPLLERLSQATGEAAHLAVRSGTDIVLIARTAATGMLQLSERRGIVRPAHATAIGKILLAACAAEDRARIVGSGPLERFTEQTITDPATLTPVLDVIARKGVAYDLQELDPDIRCVAVPVTDFIGRTVAAMGISGPVWRMQEAELTAKTAELKQSAELLSALLGADRSG